MTVAIVVILSMGVEHLNRTGWLMLNMKDKYKKMVKYSVFGIKEIIIKMVLDIGNIVINQCIN